MPSPPKTRLVPVLVIGVSLVLRLILSSKGGQHYFTDEDRYDYSLQLYRAVGSSNGDAVREILAIPTHPFFIWLGAVIAAFQHGLAQLTPFGDWTHPENIRKTLWLGAAVLSLFSTVNLLLLHRLARNWGAGEEESAWALLLMAASNTAFYYSRHFLPYDCGLSVALAALLVGTGGPTFRRAVWCGLLSGATYNLYNGYWYLVPVIWALHFYTCRQAKNSLRLAVACAFSTALMLAVPVIVGATLGGSGYWLTLKTFGASVKLGLFAEGWSLPWEYFFHSEGIFGVLLATGIILAIFLSRSLHEALPGRVKLAGTLLVSVYALLVLFSNGLKYFVVYARTVKPFVPLVCLLGGWAVYRLLLNRPQLRAMIAIGVICAAALNFWPHFNRVFPRDVEIAVLNNWGNPKHTLSIAGSLYTFSGWPVTRPDLALVNARELYPVRSYVGYPQGKTLLRVTHPLTYLPFQYESHTPRERELLRNHDISIQLIQLSDAKALSDDPPAAMLYTSKDRPNGYEREPETPELNTSHAP